MKTKRWGSKDRGTHGRQRPFNTAVLRGQHCSRRGSQRGGMQDGRKSGSVKGSVGHHFMSFLCGRKREKGE